MLIGVVVAGGCTAVNPRFDEGEGSHSGGRTSGETGAGSETANSASGSSGNTTHGGTATDVTTASSTTTAQLDPIVEFVDNAWDGEFGAATTYEGLEWTDASVQLSQRQPLAMLESRVFDGGAPRSWTSLRWKPRAAYGIALPRPEAWDAMLYPEGAIGDAQLELLLHLDDGPWSDGDPVLDSTAIQRHGTWWGPGSSATPGRFRSALSNGPDASHIDVLNPVQPGLGPFTWTLWYRGESCTNSTMVALDPVTEEPLITQSTFMMCATTAVCGGLGRVMVNMSETIRYCGMERVDDGQWHHIALRRRIDGAGQHVGLFVDGVEQQPVVNDTATSAAVVSDVSVHAEAQTPEEFTVAGGNEAIHGGAGDFDEVALWNRDLDDQEIQALYFRGARWARFQVRACDEADCHDAEFVGPTGDTMRAFLDPGASAGHEIDTSELGLVGRYVQYRFILQRDEGVPSPAIEQVQLVGELE